jgi:hypothetical protein
MIGGALFLVLLLQGLEVCYQKYSRSVTILLETHDRFSSYSLGSSVANQRSGHRFAGVIALFPRGNGRPRGCKDKTPRKMQPASLANLRPGPKRRRPSSFPPAREPRRYSGAGRPPGARDRHHPRRMNRESLNNLRPRPAWRRGDPSPNPAGRALRARFGHISEKGRSGIQRHLEQRVEEQRRSHREVEERSAEQLRIARDEPAPFDKYDWSGHRQAARARRGFGERRR